MANGGTDSSAIPGKFHWICGQGITLSEDRRTADGGRKHSNVYGAFSNDPIPNGLQFSVRILETSPHTFRLGVTTRKPDSVPQPQGLSDLISWYVVIGNGHCSAWHNKRTKVLPWDLDHSTGNTFGCRVSDKGEFHLYHNGRNVGVAWEGLPIYEQLWGFVGMVGGKVEADYTSTKVSETPSSPNPPIGPVPTSAQPKEEGASPVPTGHLRQEKCEYCPLVSTHEQVTGDHLKQCPNYPLDCPNKCDAWGLTRSKISAHLKVCLLQRVECKYKQFGCTIVQTRKDMAEHLKKSVESHLWMTKRRVEEQEVCLQEQEKRLQEQEVRLQEQEMHLQKEKDERQLLEVRLNDVKKLESDLQEEKSKHQQMEERLLEVENTLKNLTTRLN